MAAWSRFVSRPGAAGTYPACKSRVLANPQCVWMALVARSPAQEGDDARVFPEGHLQSS